MDPFDGHRDRADDGASESGWSAEEERRLAVEEVCELLGLGSGRAGTPNRLAGPITKEDRDLIVWNIDELFLV